MKENVPQARFFDWILMGSLSYWHSMWFVFVKSQFSSLMNEWMNELIFGRPRVRLFFPLITSFPFAPTPSSLFHHGGLSICVFWWFEHLRVFGGDVGRCEWFCCLYIFPNQLLFIRVSSDISVHVTILYIFWLLIEFWVYVALVLRVWGGVLPGALGRRPGVLFPRIRRKALCACTLLHLPVHSNSRKLHLGWLDQLLFRNGVRWFPAIAFGGGA